ncbi:MAG TPA: carboxypeptidase-like regulatory domain-containing protein [Anaerolineae bacterium]|nr:carboxypeptidase-like regulatory domain-containing protein [Anaerolineae bacterium]
MTAVIFGVVRDPDGNPVVGARIVYASAPVAMPDVAALTGSDGGFVLSAPAPGTYVLGCYADGYASAAVSIHVAGAETVHVQIALKRGDL